MYGTMALGSNSADSNRDAESAENSTDVLKVWSASRTHSHHRRAVYRVWKQQIAEATISSILLVVTCVMLMRQLILIPISLPFYIFGRGASVVSLLPLLTISARATRVVFG